MTQLPKKLAAFLIATCFAAMTVAQTTPAPPQNEELARAQVNPRSRLGPLTPVGH